MKIAFCFLTINNVSQRKLWERFFYAASGRNYNIYCHPKKPDQVTDPFLADNIISRLISTSYGDLSLVSAELNLFIEAFLADRENTFFILISETTIPIVPFSCVFSSLERIGPRSIISYYNPPLGSAHFRRRFSVQKFYKYAPFYQHDQWITLHRTHVKALVDSPSLSNFKKTFAADEHYFMNVLVHERGVPLDQIANRKFTFVNWRDSEVELRELGPRTVSRSVHPKTYHRLAETDLSVARESKCWFFRKVAEDCDCGDVVSLIG